MRIKKIRLVKGILCFFSLTALSAVLIFPVVSSYAFLFIALSFGIYLQTVEARQADEYLLFKFSVFKTE